MQRLPVFATVADAWRELIHDWRIFARLSVIPLAIQIVGTGLLALGAPEPAADRGMPPPGAVLRAISYALVLWLLLVPAITAWHRHVLLGPGERPDRPAYRFGRPEWIYVKRTAVVIALGSLIAVVVAIPVGVVAALVEADAGAGAAELIGAPLMMAAVALLFLLLVDWALVFPAAALDRTLKVGEARALGRGNRWRLACVIVLAYLPQLVVSDLAARIAAAILGDATASAAGHTIVLLVQTIAQYAFLAVTVGALSFSYLRLGGARSPSTS